MTQLREPTRGMDVHALQRSLLSIDAALDERSGLDPNAPMTTGDPVADEWEKAIAEGREPDWELGKKE